MKQEWKPDELRATSEEIRGAVMPKSITPEMVGGTLLGVVNALGEVVEVLGEIPREHVTVKVRGYDGTGGVSGAGATVWLDVFNTKGYPCVSLPRQELTCNEEGVVEFDVPHGFRYAVFSQIAGLGASFQLVEVSAIESRKIKLWNFPIGVHAIGRADIIYDGDEDGNGSYLRQVPFVAKDVRWDSADCQTAGEWDVDIDKEEYYDGGCFFGILVSTADTAFVIRPNNKSEQKMVWCKPLDYRTYIPTMPYIDDLVAGEAWEDIKNRARADMDGNMNTAKILDYCTEPPAALFCAGSDYMGEEQRFLPSAGQLSIMQLNRTAINALMTAFNDAGTITNFNPLLPDLKPGSTSSWTHNEIWWSSTVCSPTNPWSVHSGGSIESSNNSNCTCGVRAVSVLYFPYSVL